MRMARDLIAKRAVERDIRKKARAARKGPFHSLACCREHEHLQDGLAREEVRYNQQSAEVKDAQKARSEEVLQLGAEVLHLRQQLKDFSGSHGSDGSISDSAKLAAELQERRTDLESDLIRTTMEVERLHRRLMQQRLQLQEARQHQFKALREAANSRARASVSRELNAQEILQLRHRCFPSSSSSSKVWSSLSTDEALQAQEAGELEEVEEILSTERAAQQKERSLLEQEITAMHEKADKELSSSPRDEGQLARQCAVLHGTAAELLRGLDSQHPLPPLPSPASFAAAANMPQDLTAHRKWLQALSAEFMRAR